MTLTKGKMYRQKVDSEQGYEDWEYTGITKEAPNGLWYAFKNDLGVYHFDENDLKEFKEANIMNKYKVRGLYTISFEMEVEAENREKAEEMGYELNLETEWNGESVFTRDDAELNADGDVFDVEVELLEGDEEEDDE